MNYLLRPRIWPSFLASSGVGPCDVPFRYASASIVDLGFRISDFLQQFMIQNLIVQISPFVFSSPELFCKFSIRNPNSAIVNPVARPSSSRSLRSAQSRERVPSFVVSRQQFMKYRG